MKIEKNLVLTAAVALVIGLGLGYAGTTAFAKSGPRAAAFGASARGGMTYQMRGGAGAGLLSGTIAKMDSESITLNTRDGSSHLVLLTPATTVSKSVTGSTSDLSVGTDVLVTGATNSDGSVSASAVTIRPAGSPMNAPMIPAPQPQ
jgi:hypothetical protein